MKKLRTETNGMKEFKTQLPQEGLSECCQQGFSKISKFLKKGAWASPDPDFLDCFQNTLSFSGIGWEVALTFLSNLKKITSTLQDVLVSDPSLKQCTILIKVSITSIR